MPRILLVEDDETSREMLALRLELNGFDVLCATNGADAIDQAFDGSPDLILLDMNLPKVDGWAIARKLKDNVLTSSIPIIGVSAHAMPGDRERALDCGCTEYETKPVDWAALGPKICALLKDKLA